MPAEFRRCVSERLLQGQSVEQAATACTLAFKRRHKETAPTIATQMLADAQMLTQALPMLEEDLSFPSSMACALKLKNFSHSYMRGMVDPLQITINAIHPEKREIEGYASYYNAPMRNGVVMVPGCFTPEDLAVYMTNPVLLRNHDPDRPVGNVLRLWDDGQGLMCRAEIKDEATWEDIATKKVIRALSWAGNVVRYHFEPETKNTACDAEEKQALHVDEAAMMEISVVTIPNSPQSLFHVVKAHGDAPTSLTLWAPVRQVDTSERMVYGYATIFGEPDADGHVMTREAVENALSEYARWANVREMHQYQAVGTAPVLQVDDTGLWVGIAISKGAENCWEKIQDRTYKGFSIGGECLQWEAGVLDGNPVIFLNAIRIDEITICDRPKVASATFSLIKRLNQKKNIPLSETKTEPCNHAGGTPLSTELEIETQKLGFAQNILSWLGIGKTETQNSNPQFVSGENKATLSYLAPVVENRYLRKEEEETFLAMQTQMTELAEQMKQLLSRQPVETPAITDPGVAVVENKAEVTPEVKHSLSPEFVATYEKNVAAGSSKIEAYNAAITELAGEDTEKALSFLGLSTPTPETEVTGLLTRIMARLDSQDQTLKELSAQTLAAQNAAKHISRARLSGPVTPDVLHAASVTPEESVWDGLNFPTTRRQ